MVAVERSQVWWADLEEPRGSEPGFRRPLLIVQDDVFNRGRIALNSPGDVGDERHGDSHWLGSATYFSSARTIRRGRRRNQARANADPVAATWYTTCCQGTTVACPGTGSKKVSPVMCDQTPGP